MRLTGEFTIRPYKGALERRPLVRKVGFMTRVGMMWWRQVQRKKEKKKNTGKLWDLKSM